MYSFWVDSFCDDASVVGDILDHFVESTPLDLLPLEVAQWVGNKIKDNAALLQLPCKQHLDIVGSRI